MKIRNYYLFLFMKRFVVFLIVFSFFALPLEARAYLSDEWTRQCGKVSYTNGFFFLKGLRLYSRADWKEAFGYVGKDTCVEGYLEKKNGKNIGISYHIMEFAPQHFAPAETSTEEISSEEISPKTDIQKEAPTPLPTVSAHEDKLQTYFGFLVGSKTRTYLQLDNGQRILLLKTVWHDSYGGPKFFIEGRAIIRDSIIRSIRDPHIYTLQEYAQAYPSNDLSYDEFFRAAAGYEAPADTE